MARTIAHRRRRWRGTTTSPRRTTGIDGAVRVIENASVDTRRPGRVGVVERQRHGAWLRLLLAEGRAEGGGAGCSPRRRSRSSSAADDGPGRAVLSDRPADQAALDDLRPGLVPAGLAGGWWTTTPAASTAWSAIVGLVPRRGARRLRARQPRPRRGAPRPALADPRPPRSPALRPRLERRGQAALRREECRGRQGPRRGRGEAGGRHPPQPAAGALRRHLPPPALRRRRDPAGGEGLRLVFAPGLQGRLEHWHYDTFRVRWDRPWQAPELVTVGLDAAGNPARLELFGEELRRVPEEAPAGAAH